MEEDKKMLLKAKEELDAKVVDLAKNPSILSAQSFMEIANEPYDAELPMGDVANEVATTKSVNKGDDYKYYVNDPTVKTVYTSVGGTVTAVAITPQALNTLSFSGYKTPNDYIFIDDLLETKYDTIASKVKDQHEGLNRLENKIVLDLAITAAESKSNTFANDSGDEVIDYEVLVKMVRSMAKYGSKLVLASGSTVSTDLALMDYSENKNRPVTVESAGISKWIKVEDFQYVHSGTKTPLAADKAVLIATSDAENNRPIHVVRRKTISIGGGGNKERVTFFTGPVDVVNQDKVLGYSVITYENLGAVVVNANACAVYKKAASYA